MVVLCDPLIHAQDLSKYRNFSFGMSAASVSKLAEERPADVIVIHERPALIQQLTWYPPLPFESVRPAEPVQKVLFSFYNGELYRMLVTYDSDAVRGLTSEDMIRMLSAKYGTAAKPAAEVNFPTERRLPGNGKGDRSLGRPAIFIEPLPVLHVRYTFAVVMFAKVNWMRKTAVAIRRIL